MAGEHRRTLIKWSLQLWRSYERRLRREPGLKLGVEDMSKEDLELRAVSVRRDLRHLGLYIYI